MLLLNGARWQSGDVIRVRFLEGDDDLKARVQQAAEDWTAPGMANLTLEFVDEGDAEVRITFVQGDGSWSVLGTECRNVGQSEATMNYGWLTSSSDDTEVRQVVLHEFGHALGLIHEHQNPEGGIDWNERAVIDELSGPPNNWDEATIRFNVLDRYDPEDTTGTNVDPYSIMMYPIPATWTNDGFSAGFNDDLSDTDREFIQGAYP
jgi:serralysin